MDVTIRGATKAPPDVDAMVDMTVALHRLHEACDPRCTRLLDDAANVYRDEALKWLDDADTRVMLAENEAGQIVAMAIGRIERRPDRVPAASGHIRRVFVKEGCRRGGIGRRLLAPLCDFFDGHGVSDVQLHYMVRNAAGERFWTRLGFQPFLMMAKATLADLTGRLSE
ncbi:MAG TPA: GNAT family N-acetyltransferase [Planctomycetota bacterium]|nr:GNAT family N-acetyltransferase [Planctomycetota bacterium]